MARISYADPLFAAKTLAMMAKELSTSPAEGISDLVIAVCIIVRDTKNPKVPVDEAIEVLVSAYRQAVTGTLKPENEG